MGLKIMNNSREEIINWSKYPCRTRRLTPKESLRLMGVSDKDINRLLYPEQELKKIGYTEDDINRLLVHRNRDKDLYKQAGNSIVVDVLCEIFKRLLIDSVDDVKAKLCTAA